MEAHTNLQPSNSTWWIFQAKGLRSKNHANHTTAPYPKKYGAFIFAETGWKCRVHNCSTFLFNTTAVNKEWRKGEGTMFLTM